MVITDDSKALGKEKEDDEEMEVSLAVLLSAPSSGWTRLQI